MVRDDRDGPKPEIWGRRAYVDKQAREILNDRSRTIAREQPERVDDPGNPSLSDVLLTEHDPEEKGRTLVSLMRDDMTFQEAVVWYWWRYCSFDLREIQFGIDGIETSGGDPVYRSQSLRNVIRILKSAAHKAPHGDPDDVPDVDDVLGDASPDPDD